MGYSADKVSGGDIVLPLARFTEILDALAEAEKSGGGYSYSKDQGYHNHHLSWCDKVGNYDRTPEGLAKILEDYGFWEPAIDAEAGTITISDWGGDKLGSDWSTFWEILGRFATEPVTWVMCGEDYDHWAEAIDGKGGWQTRSVTINVDVD